MSWIQCELRGEHSYRIVKVAEGCEGSGRPMRYVREPIVPEGLEASYLFVRNYGNVNPATRAWRLCDGTGIELLPHYHPG